MDEFSPGEKILHSGKMSNVSKNSSKKYQLRADVKQKIKQRLHRDKPKEVVQGFTLPTTNTGRKNLSQCNTEINKGSYIANVAEKLWSMKRNPHLYNEKFVYAGRVPCFLKRNIKKVDKENRTRYTRPIKPRKFNKNLSLFYKRKAPKAKKEFYFRFIKHKNTKRPASGWIDNDRVKRLCLEPEDSKGKTGGRIGEGAAKTVEHLANGKVDNERLCGNPQKQTLERRDKHNHDNDDLRICKPTSFELLNKEKECYPKGWSKNGSYNESSRPKTTGLSFKLGGGTMENSECNESPSIFKATSSMEDNSEEFKINMVRKYPSENSRQVRSPISNREKLTRELSISLMDCKLFSNCLNTRQTLSQDSFQTTSTPRAMSVPTKFQDVPTSHITPRVPNSRITMKGPKLHITQRVPTSNITPPESEVSCTEDESSVFTKKEEFERDKFRGSSTEKNVRAVVYKPLFSNRPRLWKSVVVENDS